jgi:hypothetical protein
MSLELLGYLLAAVMVLGYRWLKHPLRHAQAANWLYLLCGGLALLALEPLTAVHSLPVAGAIGVVICILPRLLESSVALSFSLHKS